MRPVATEHPDEYVTAPWRPEVVSYLNRRQGAGGSAYTCRRHTTIPMLATKRGWVCPMPGRWGETCDHRQDWVRRRDLPSRL